MIGNLYRNKKSKMAGRLWIPKLKRECLAAMRATEKKYGKKKLRNYYHTDFEWGMLNGKLPALRWVLVTKTDMLDT